MLLSKLKARNISNNSKDLSFLIKCSKFLNFPCFGSERCVEIFLKCSHSGEETPWCLYVYEFLPLCCTSCTLPAFFLLATVPLICLDHCLTLNRVQMLRTGWRNNETGLVSGYYLIFYLLCGYNIYFIFYSTLLFCCCCFPSLSSVTSPFLLVSDVPYELSFFMVPIALQKMEGTDTFFTNLEKQNLAFIGQTLPNLCEKIIQNISGIQCIL